MHTHVANSIYYYHPANEFPTIILRKNTILIDSFVNSLQRDLLSLQSPILQFNLEQEHRD